MTDLTPEHLQKLYRIAEVATPEPPDVPERCWYCERELAIETIRVECAYCGADVARACEWLDALDAALAEVERWKRRYDALRAAVIKADELIVDAIHRATAMYNHTQDADYESHSDGLDEALTILRQVLAEAGGVE